MNLKMGVKRLKESDSLASYFNKFEDEPPVITLTPGYTELEVAEELIHWQQTPWICSPNTKEMHRQQWEKYMRGKFSSGV